MRSKKEVTSTKIEKEDWSFKEGDLRLVKMMRVLSKGRKRMAWTWEMSDEVYEKS